MPFDPFQPLGCNLAYRAKQNFPFNNRKTSHPNDTGYLQAAADEIWVIFPNNFIKSRNGMIGL